MSTLSLSIASPADRELAADIIAKLLAQGVTFTAATTSDNVEITLTFTGGF